MLYWCTPPPLLSENSSPLRFLHPSTDGRARNQERVSFRPQEEEEEEEEEEGSPCIPIGQLHLMAGFYPEGSGGRDRPELEPALGLASEGSESSQECPASPGSPLENNRKRARPALHEDMEMGGSGSSGSGTESHGNESHGNDSQGNESVGSSSGNGKDSALTETSESNKR